MLCLLDEISQKAGQISGWLPAHGTIMPERWSVGVVRRKKIDKVSLPIETLRSAHGRIRQSLGLAIDSRPTGLDSNDRRT